MTVDCGEKPIASCKEQHALLASAEKTVRVERSSRSERSRNDRNPSTSRLRRYAQGERTIEILNSEGTP